MWMFQSLENQCVGLCQLHIYGLTHLRFDKPSKMWKAPDENLKKNRFSFSYKSCSKVFSTSFTFKSSHERMEVTEVAVVNSVCFWLPFNGDRSGELGLQGFWQQTRQLKPPRILLRTSLHLWNDFPFKQTMSLWGKQEFIWEPDRYPPNSEGTFNDFFFFLCLYFLSILTRPNRSSKIIHHMKSKASKK